MVDSVSGFDIIAQRHKDINAIDPQEAVLPEKQVTPVGTKTGLVAPDNDYIPTPLIGDIKPLGLDDESVIEDKPSILTTVGAAIAPTARDWGNGFYEKYEFERDFDYTDEQALEDVDEFQRMYGIASEEEVRYMSLGTKSAAHMQHKWERILDKRDDNKALAANPITGVVASMLDADLVAAYTPLGYANLATKVGRVGERVVKGLTAAGVAGTINEVVDDTSLRTDFEQGMDMLSFGLVGALANTSKVVKGTNTTSAVGSADGTVAGVATSEAKVSDEAVGALPKREDTIISDETDWGIVRDHTDQMMREDVRRRNAEFFESIGQSDKAKALLESITGSTSRPIQRTDTTLDSQIDAELKALGQGDGTPINIYGTEVRISLNAPMKGEDLVPDNLKNTKVGSSVDSRVKWLGAKLSSSEKVFQYINYDLNHPAARLLASARTQGDNAIYAAATHQANLDHRLMGLGDGIKEVTQEVYNTNPILGYAEHTSRMGQVQAEYTRHMQVLDSQVLKFIDRHDRNPTPKELDDFITTSGAPPHIQKLQRTYIKSGFAEEAYDLISHAKLLEDDTMEKIVRRPTYTPVRHSYQNMRNLIKKGVVDAEELYKFLGRQIERMYPELVGKTMKYNISTRNLGKNFFDAKRETDNATAMVTTGGFTKESLTLLMKRSGLDEDKAMQIADNAFRSRDTTVSAGGQSGNLRARLNWDWEASFEGLDGNFYSMADLVDHDVYKTLRDYSRNTSHRIGLAQYGVKSQNDLERITQDLVENRPDNVTHAEAKQFASNVKAQLLGQPVGEAVSPIIRSAQTVGGSIVLSGGGIWGVNDLVTQTYKVGLLRSLPHVVKALGTVFKSLKGMSKTDVNDFYEILRGRLGTGSGWEHIMTRYDDAFDVSKNIHGTIAHLGQSTRFMNGSEFIRRFQINLLAGIFESAFKGAAKGSAKDIKYLKETFKFSDDLITSVAREYKAHKGTIDNWSQDARLDVMQKIQYEADNLAHTIRAGEAPAFMEHSTIGKVMFPFMQYAFAMQEKMLRNTYHRDGAAAVAMIAAVQFPTAIMLGAVNNVKNGKDWDEDLAASSVNAFSILGAFGVPLSMILSGYGTGSSSAMIPVDTTMRLGAKLFGEDSEVTGRDILKVTPLNTFLPLPLILNAFEEG